MQPLDILVHGMRLFASVGLWTKACEIAADAAPFIHPRLQTVAQRNIDAPGFDISKLTNEELAARIARLDALLQIDMEPAADAAETEAPRRTNGAMN